MLLLIFASLRILVLEDEVDLRLLAIYVSIAVCPSYLVGGTTLVRTEHDHVGRSVGELLGMQLLVVLQQLHVGTAAFKTVLKLDFILHDQGLALVVNLFWELRRDGMVCGWILENKTFVS